MLCTEFERDAQSLREWLDESAILNVNRGYRDVLPLLDRLGIDHRMPALLSRGERQLTTFEANDSRLITETQWIIEARNGHIRSIFKFFKDVISVVDAVHLRDFYLIAGATINKYRETIQMLGATAETARRILQAARKDNELKLRVEAEKLGRRPAQWNRLNANQVLDFPRLALNYSRTSE